jgi:hypothetical protein
MKAWKWIALTSMAAASGCGADGRQPSGEVDPDSYSSEDDGLGHKCEGPEGLVCPDGKYCAAAKTSSCPGIETLGACRPIPEVCVDIYQPACGCDGQTYGNACRAAVAGVAIAHDGACAPLCGGFAGLPCPGAGTCVDNATDACDPMEGDADCASLCQCDAQQPCGEGAHWDSSPEVCSCVWE